MDCIRIAVIGVGRIGRMHAEAIAAGIPGLKLVAVVDPSVDCAWAQSLGVEVAVKDASEVLAREDVDAVLIATGSAFHVSLIRQAAASGKQIFCEKPIAFDTQLLAQVQREVADAGVQLMVGLNRRFDPQFRALRGAIRRGDIGSPQLVRITNRDPRRPPLEFIPHSGGLFMDFTVHDFDMARFVTGEDIVEVHAMGAALVDSRIAELGDIDTAILSLRMESGALCTIDNSREAVYGYDQRLEVLGPGGSLRVENVSPLRCLHSHAEGITAALPERSFVERYAESYVCELEAFATCLREGTPMPTTVTDVIHAVRAAQAAQRSLQEGCTVRL